MVKKAAGVLIVISIAILLTLLGLYIYSQQGSRVEIVLPMTNEYHVARIQENRLFDWVGPSLALNGKSFDSDQVAQDCDVLVKKDGTIIEKLQNQGRRFISGYTIACTMTNGDILHYNANGYPITGNS